MPFLKTDNVAMYKGADWSHFIKTVPNCSPEEARRIATADAEISFFFCCRSRMVLENPSWSEPKVFSPGDAVFFSGEPWWGNAPQCDGYLKDGMSIAYTGGNDLAMAMNEAASFETAQGLNAVDVVILFAANLNVTVKDTMFRLAPNTGVPHGGTLAVANDTMKSALENNIKPLQDKGILVLLTMMGNHDAAGWSNFDNTAEGIADAKCFTVQLLEALKTYGLDGIDIDDEYSQPDMTNANSLAMVTTFLQEKLSEHSGFSIVTKALWNDKEQFAGRYNGISLADNLTFGSCMGYGSDPEYWLGEYVKRGMRKDNLLMGYWTGDPVNDPGAEANALKQEGYAGIMAFGIEKTKNQKLMGTLVDGWMGPGNWNKI